MNDHQMMKMDLISTPTTSFYTRILLFAIGILCATAPLSSSAQRFNAGLLVGVNASQIDGDRAAGYNKLGLNAGIRATTYLTDKSEISIDILYSQRGSQSDFNLGTSFVPFKIKTDYIEVPVLFNYKDWLIENDDEGYYKITVSGGLAYGRLFEVEIDDEAPNSSLVQLEEFFRKNDLSIVIGASFNITEHIGVMTRWTRSILPIYKAGESPINAPSFVGKFLTFHAFYMF